MIKVKLQFLLLHDKKLVFVSVCQSSVCPETDGQCKNTHVMLTGRQWRSTGMQGSTGHVASDWHQQLWLWRVRSERSHARLDVLQLDPANHWTPRVNRTSRLAARWTKCSTRIRKDQNSYPEWRYAANPQDVFYILQVCVCNLVS